MERGENDMKKFFLLLMAAIALLAVSACTQATTETTFANPNDTYCSAGRVDGVFLCSRSWIEFYNTTITLTLYVTETDAYDIPAVFSSVETILRNYHRLFDRYHTYPDLVNIRSVNLANTTSTVVSQELFDALVFAVGAADDIQSEGVMLFNPALGPVLNIWHDARDNPLCVSDAGVDTCPVPASSLLAGPFNVDLADVILDAETRSVTFAKSGMELDLGGFGKGYVAEIVTDLLDGLGIRYLFNGGNSNVKVGGVNPTTIPVIITSPSRRRPSASTPTIPTSSICRSGMTPRSSLPAITRTIFLARRTASSTTTSSIRGPIGPAARRWR